MADTLKDFDKFIAAVKVDDVSGCWVWQKWKDKDGYGMFRKQNSGAERAHRWAWQHYRGEIPAANEWGGTLHVLHRCDNPSCVNPDHLYLGTNKDNVRDKMLRGRHFVVSGERHPDAKITEQDVLAIRASDKPYATLASEYGVAESTIGSIKQRKSWRHLLRQDDDTGLNKGKNRGRRGKQHYNATLSEGDVRAIRSSTERGAVLARYYKVSQQTITDIRMRRSWRHIE